MDVAAVRLMAFFGIFLLMAVAEARWPRRALTQGRQRWPANLAIVVLNALLMRLLLPAGAVGVAVWAQGQQFGLFHVLHLAPSALLLVAAVVLLDLIIYLQHRLFHRVPLLWRLHMVHHADRDIDVTTGLRFHPIEIMLSMLIKAGVILLLGIPATAVVIFEIVLNGMAMFNHANVRLPAALDAWLRYLVITPDLHRVHHSVIRAETNSNYGFNLSIWDRLFGSWRAAPALGHARVQIGLADLQQAPTHRLLFMLKLPFANQSGDYAGGAQTRR